MKRLSVAGIVCCIVLAGAAAHGAENATVTEDNIPLMKGPSFISDEVGAVMKHERVEVLSRTSFTDHLAAVPDDYWYLVRVPRGGDVLAAYIHGSVLNVDPGVSVPVAAPPGAAPASGAGARRSCPGPLGYAFVRFRPTTA